MPLTTYRPGETVLAAGTKTGRLLILKKGAVTIRKNGTVIAEVTEPGAVFGELSALLNQPHTADVRTLEASEFRETLCQDCRNVQEYDGVFHEQVGVRDASQMKLSLN